MCEISFVAALCGVIYVYASSSQDELCELLGLREDFRLDLYHRSSSCLDSSFANEGSTHASNHSSNSNNSNSNNKACVAGLEGTMYASAVGALRKIGRSFSSTAKVAAVASACREVCTAVGSWHQARALKDFDAQVLLTDSAAAAAAAAAAATAAASAASSNGVCENSSGGSSHDNASSSATRSHEDNTSARAACALKARSKGQLAADDMLPVLQLLLVFGAVTEPHGGALRHLGAEGEAYMFNFR